MKRAVVLLGAGASVEYGAPTTDDLSKIIKSQILTNDQVKLAKGDKLFKKIVEVLDANRRSVNFEHIYHCVHELIYTFRPIGGALDLFNPVL